jgi:hypothetical protein
MRDRVSRRTATGLSTRVTQREAPIVAGTVAGVAR